MNNKQTTAMQELVRQINGAIQIIDEHGKLNDYTQCRKEVYQSVLDVATELLTKEREIRKADAIAFAEWIPHNAYIVEDEYYFCLLKNGIRVSLEELYELFTQNFKQD